MDYIKTFLFIMTVLFLKEQSDKHLGKEATRLFIVFILAISVVVHLWLHNYIAAGFGFVITCGYIFFVSESEPKDHNEEENEEDPS